MFSLRLQSLGHLLAGQLKKREYCVDSSFLYILLGMRNGCSNLSKRANINEKKLCNSNQLKVIMWHDHLYSLRQPELI